MKHHLPQSQTQSLIPATPQSHEPLLFPDAFLPPVEAAKRSLTEERNTAPHLTIPMVLFIDMNAFFASVEQQDNPQLRNTPIAVIPVPSDHTSVIAPSYEARAFGIKTGMKVHEARSLCPHVTFVLSRPERYLEVHRHIVDILARHFNTLIPLSVDEVACVLERSDRTQSEAERLARIIKDDFRRELGDNLTCSIGIAPNIFLAKVASDLKKPDGLTFFGEDYPDRLKSLKLQDLPNIGPRREKQLRSVGIDSVADLWNASPKAIHLAFNNVSGEKWPAMLRGSLSEDYQQGRAGTPQALTRSQVLAPTDRTAAGARRVAMQLANTILSELRSMRRGARAMELVASDAIDLRLRVRRQEMFRAYPSATLTEWGRELGQMADFLCSQQRRYQWVRVAAFEILPLTDERGLFDADPRKARAVGAAMDKINARFGPHAIQSAAELGPRERRRVIPFGAPKRSPPENDR